MESKMSKTDKNMTIREFLTEQGFENATVGSPTMKLSDYQENNPYNMCYDIDRNTAVTIYDHIRNGFFNVSLWSKVHQKRWDYLLKTKNKSFWMKKKKEYADKDITELCSYCKKDKVSSEFECEECEYKLCQKCFDDGKGRICWTDTNLCEICDKNNSVGFFMCPLSTQ